VRDLPLTVGTAGHIDHGKTELVRALTGVDTDRLPEERARGITIVLGFAPLRLPGGRRLSLIDVPGHERLVRVMVSGATGIDLYLAVVAADDGVMPQTLEHARVLRALGLRNGVVAVTKSDLADPVAAAAEAAALFPEAEVVACSARTGEGVRAVASALERAAARAPSRANREPPEAAVLHVDRAFTIHGAGTVVTGTLWSGRLARGQRLALLPAEREVRVRGLQVHDRAVEEAAAGQRVAVNLTGVPRAAVSPGDALAGSAARIRVVYRLEAELALDEPLPDRERVQVHHGTRDTPARAVSLGGARWQLRCERPLLVASGDRLVLRRISPPSTIGGGVVVSAGSAQPKAAPAPATAPAPPPAPAGLDPAAEALARRLLAAGASPPGEAELGEDARHLRALRDAGLAVRVGRAMYAHPEALAQVRAAIVRVIEAEGSITLARLRDELAISRKYAQALLEHFDAARVTRRLPDDRRVLRRAAQRSDPDRAAPTRSARPAGSPEP
jgi:selenocysteine-specific elongation factor